MFLRRTEKLSAVSKPAKVVALTLCGEASEYGCLRHVLGFKPENIIFVDHDAGALKNAKAKNPNVQTFHGDIDDALDILEGIGAKLSFVHLDFMGLFQPGRRASLQKALRKLAPQGFLFYSLFRGRDRHIMDDLLELAPNAGADLDLLRAASIATAARQYCHEAELIYFMRYLAEDPNKKLRHSPMATLGFQRMPPGTRTSDWRRVFQNDETQYTSYLPPALVEGQLRESVVNLRKEGKSSKQIASILDVQPGRVAAWLAHSTRGSYATRKGKK